MPECFVTRNIFLILKCHAFFCLLYRYRLYVTHSLPQLQFLDSQPISDLERLESYHSGHVALTHAVVIRPQSQSLHHSGPILKKSNVRLSQEDDDDVDLGAGGREERPPSKVFYGKLRYRYSGKHSEGNRFIVDSDL
jgi:hypothetical protein